MTTDTQTLPKVNVDLVLNIWDWLTAKQGQADNPIWYQYEFMTAFDFNDSDERDEYFDVVETPVEIDKNYCGTACCVAGYAMIDVTDRTNFTMILGSSYIDADGEKVVIGKEEDAYRSSIVSWEYHAKRRIGLTIDEANELFCESNELADIREILNGVLESRGELVRLV